VESRGTEQPVAAGSPPAREAEGARSAAPERRGARPREGRGRLGRLALGAAAIGVVLLAWYLVARAALIKPLFLPSPGSVWDAFMTANTDGYRGYLLWEHVAISLQRVLIAFVLATLIAVPLGMLVASSRTLETIVDPFVNFYRPLPPLAYYTLLVIWFGIGERSKVLLLLLAAFPPIFIATVQGVRGVRRERIDAARSLGAGRRKTLRYVVFPSILPDVFTGMRVSIGFTYTTLVAAEMVAAKTGIGWLVLDASRFLQTSYVFMGIIVMGVTGILLDALVKAAQRRAVPWLGRA
jgi:taurine transport system permease protein